MLKALHKYVRAHQLPTSIFQVDLETHPKNNQYEVSLRFDPPQGLGLGYSGCGFVAMTSRLLRGPGAAGQARLDLIQQLRCAAGSTFTKEDGIMPSPLANACRGVLGEGSVVERNKAVLEEIYASLQDGMLVVVDILAAMTPEMTEVPALLSSDQISFSFAHYARVLGLDEAKERIFLENTLTGPIYWDLSLKEFIRIWKSPESLATKKPDKIENVDRWFVAITGETTLNQER